MSTVGFCISFRLLHCCCSSQERLNGFPFYSVELHGLKSCPHLRTENTQKSSETMMSSDTVWTGFLLMCTPIHTALPSHYIQSISVSFSEHDRAYGKSLHFFVSLIHTLTHSLNSPSVSHHSGMCREDNILHHHDHHQEIVQSYLRIKYLLFPTFN